MAAKCPVCGRALKAKFTKGLKSDREGLMVTCEYDSRHVRMFFNDPAWCEKARTVSDPLVLLSAAK